ncbi:hypothetical protein FRC08_006765 [Ceratobasidium sp. 394]|nr:hypothetical protein FRC08_006765 [Ceratobasidium sp. 394]
MPPCSPSRRASISHHQASPLRPHLFAALNAKLTFTLRTMQVSRLIIVTILAATGADALHCCCSGEDVGSAMCCREVMGKGTFYSPRCGLIYGQTCDVGDSRGKQEHYKNCCIGFDGKPGSCF